MLADLRDAPPTVRRDLLAGLTVALLAIPQCMAFATMAGLPPAMGLYAAVVMGLVGGAISASPHAIIGPNVTTSPMVLAVLATSWPGAPENWPLTAGVLAVLAGGFTLVAALLRAGQFVRFVSHSVLLGLTVGAAILMIGSQIGPFLGIEAARSPTLLGITLDVAQKIGDTHWPAVITAGATMAITSLGFLFGPRFPAGAVALVAGAFMVWLLPQLGVNANLAMIGAIPSELPAFRFPTYDGTHTSELFVGAAAIAMVNILQTLTVTRAFAHRSQRSVSSRRELVALGSANLAAGFLSGFPGAASFSRAGLNALCGARTRLSGLSCAVAIAIFVLLAAPFVQLISKPAIAGLLMATAFSMVNWRECRELLLRGGADRLVLLVTIVCVLVVPLHWAILIGLGVSIALFLRRVSHLHMFEMVTGDGDHFAEHALDSETGRSQITMLQIEGPLFFAHADELAGKLERVLERGPRVTIIRMRRTQQIDFSVISAMNRVLEGYVAAGGCVILCGLQPALRQRLLDSPLGRTIGPSHMLSTTRTVFGSAHEAIRLAAAYVLESGGAKRFRSVS